MPVFDVAPASETKWGVYVDGELFAVSKSSVDCDFAAEMIAKLVKDATVNHHPDRRQAQMDMMAESEKLQVDSGGRDVRIAAQRMLKEGIGKEREDSKDLKNGV